MIDINVMIERTTLISCLTVALTISLSSISDIIFMGIVFPLWGVCWRVDGEMDGCRYTPCSTAPSLHHDCLYACKVYLNIYSCTVLSMQVSSLIAGQGACFGSENRPNGCCDGQVAVVDGSNWSIINYHWLQHYLYCYLVIYRLQSTHQPHIHHLYSLGILFIL